MFHKKKFATILMMTWMLIACMFIHSTYNVHASIIEVGPDGYHMDINSAMLEASDGDKILVHGGIYSENVVIDKSVDLKAVEGEHVVIDGGGMEYGISSMADHVNLEGFTIINCTTGVVLREVGNNHIDSLNISQVDDGLILVDSEDVTVVDVDIIEPRLRGFRALGSSDIDVRDITINNSGYHPGYIMDSDNVSISNSVFHGEQGLYLNRCSAINLLDGHISKGVGIEGDEPAHFDSHHIINNTVERGELHYIVDKDEHHIKDSEGQIVMVNITRSSLYYNSLSGVEAGILMAYCQENTIFGNTLVENFQGMVLYRSSNNTIYHNNFINNTRQVYSYDGSPGENTWYIPEDGGNHWSDYHGEDSNGDRMGDTEAPHPSRDKGGGFYRLDSLPLINITYQVEQILNLDMGWNFVSTGIVSPSYKIDTLLECIDESYDKVILWDPSIGRWLSYVPDRVGHFNPLQNISRGDGFWIHCLEEVDLTMRGMSPPSTNIVLYKGWNMIGIPSRTTMAGDELPEDVTLVGVFNGSQEYLIDYKSVEDIDMEPNNGYMVKVETDETIIWNVDW